MGSSVGGGVDVFRVEQKVHQKESQEGEINVSLTSSGSNQPAPHGGFQILVSHPVSFSIHLSFCQSLCFIRTLVDSPHRSVTQTFSTCFHYLL